MNRRMSNVSLLSLPLLTFVLLAATCCFPGVIAERGGWGEGVGEEEEMGCGDGGEGRGLGDKWFDGCRWCVCTSQGPRCSSSVCPSLVQQVPACHVPGQSWKDGCYRCHCRRHGITCRLDVTCRSLRHQPVPCLADERCVCGADGVPSCTAEVIDRQAFVARRIQLGGGQHVLEAARDPLDAHGRHRGHRVQGLLEDGRSSSVQRVKRRRQSGSEDRFGRGHHIQLGWKDRRAGSQNSLNFPIMREHTVKKVHEGFSWRSNAFPVVNSQPRWNSHQLDQSLHADDPAQELLIMSDNLCRFGERWYGGSLRCFCDQDGAIACGNPLTVLAFFDDFRVKAMQCEEGHWWQDGCTLCTCHMNGVTFCGPSQDCDAQHTLDERIHLRQEQLGAEQDLDTILDRLSAARSRDQVSSSSTPADPYLKKGVLVAPAKERCTPGRQWRMGCMHCRCTRHHRQVCSRRHCRHNVDTNLSSQEEEEEEDVEKPAFPSNRAKDVPNVVVADPSFRRSRKPMLVAPKPGGGRFQLPAYALGSRRPSPPRGPCARFRAGHKYWDDCNLCVCTSRGPRCQGKLCH